MKPSISAIILTQNERENIERCLDSVSWCDEAIIVDDYSEDETIERIKNYELRIKNRNVKLKILKRHLNGDFAAQRNFGLTKAKSEWVLFIDADEVISEKLVSEIKSQISRLHLPSARADGGQANLKPDEISGFYFRRRDYFLGRWLKFGETASVKLLRLARRNAGRWQGRVHEVWDIKGKKSELENPVLHRPHQTVASFLEEINRYTDLVAQYRKEQGRKTAVWEIIFYPPGKFLENYIFRLGFLDGVPGLIMSLMMSFHSFLVRSKLWMMEEHNGKAT